MAREVRHEATGPLKLDEDDIDEEKGDVAVCLCGLSANRPFCDGSHRATRDESEGTVYKYEGDDDESPRHEIAEIVYADERRSESDRGSSGGDAERE
ncbi:CDGSH iron-sulfur domain-containing protein [Halopelagius longus]|uniref:CDGSH iron-sulfur domain-containing protein n=1 Tax=Halopelagius longus TaxID=1236180 RepID=A0A1H1AK78_9EURY|nr:CDGSH iron-sulfur domain-containing protein [Halopelagius longus]RDI70409.1 CDGSH iron-sulfur domain-containing protein [Halopelagius longus]SDQ40064.1 Iron-binding zinc finger CDGSH type [Halopelagius longus]